MPGVVVIREGVLVEQHVPSEAPKAFPCGFFRGQFPHVHHLGQLVSRIHGGFRGGFAAPSTLSSLAVRMDHLVLELRFGLLSGRPKTLEEVSQAIGRTRERVRQIQNQALKKLRDRMNEENLLN